MRKPLVVGNWKMNLDLEEARRLILDIRLGLVNIDEDIEVVVCPPFIYLSMVNYQLPSHIKLGAQDVFWEIKGAYTGEISPRQLKDIGCDYVICGHSERRIHLKETNEMIASKVQISLKEGLTPILCLGETKEERDKELTKKVIEGQLEMGLKDVKIDEVKKVVLAYEPVWAIGSGLPATGDNVNEIVKFIREVIGKQYDSLTKDKIRILYGGSVDVKTIDDFVRQPEIDGVLVGGASLKANDFINIVKHTLKITKEKSK